MNANAAMVNGRPIACPIICDRWLFAYRVKSGMLRLSVDQYATLAVRCAGKIDQKGLWSACSALDAFNTRPSPPALEDAHHNSTTPPNSSSGAENDSSHLIPSS